MSEPGMQNCVNNLLEQDVHLSAGILDASALLQQIAAGWALDEDEQRRYPDDSGNSRITGELKPIRPCTRGRFSVLMDKR